MSVRYWNHDATPNLHETLLPLVDGRPRPFCVTVQPASRMWSLYPIGSPPRETLRSETTLRLLLRVLGSSIRHLTGTVERLIERALTQGELFVRKVYVVQAVQADGVSTNLVCWPDQTKANLDT
jgi:hypothetical protein